MVAPAEDLTVALQDACGVRPATPADAAGATRAPRWVASPGNEAELAAALAVASAHDLAVLFRGGGGKLGWGGRPVAVDLVIDLSGLAGIVEHYVDDQVVVVRAGTRLADLQAALAAHAQRAAIDPGSPEATIGGLLAAGEAGPLRHRYGAPRDQVLGARFVRSDGSVARSGGRVVKNVAGYDIAKLLCGSFGTLAAFSEITLRVHPMPAARSWITRAVYTPGEAYEIVAAVLDSRIEAAAIELDHPNTANGTLSVLVEGSVTGVAARTEAARRLLGTTSVASGAPPQWWGTYPWDPAGVNVKIAAPVADLHSAIYTLRDSVGSAVPVRGSVGVGVCYATLNAASAADALAAVRHVLLGRGGTCVVVSAPDDVRDKLDLWGDVHGLDLMRSVKDRFDPGGILAAGRFVGGI